MNSQDTIEQFISRMKTRYSRDHPILDLLYLIEMLRQETATLNDPKSAQPNDPRATNTS